MKPINELTPFGVFTRNLRSNRGETVEDMCKKLGVTRTYLTLLEVGESERVTIIPIYLLNKITRCYDLSFNETIKLAIAVKQTNKDIQRLSLHNLSDEHKEKILNYAYTLMIEEVD